MEKYRRTIWTEQKIIDGIKEVMKQKGIERMPSRSEIDRHYGNSALTNKISKTGGFYFYADKLGLEIKESETALGTFAQNFVRLKLITLGFDAEKTSTKFPYDLLVNRRVKIDVKSGRIFQNSTGQYYAFNLEKKFQTCDFFIAVTLGKNDEIKKIYIIPSSILSGKTQLSIGVEKSIYNKYIDRWDLIEMLDTAYVEIEAS
jgi:hypothetical protein